MIFRVTAGLDQIPAAGLLPRRIQEHQARGKLDRGAAAQPGAGRKIGESEIVEPAGRLPAELGEGGEHAERVVQPAIRAGHFPQRPGRGRNNLVIPVACKTPAAVLPPCDRHPNGAVDRRAQDNAAVVVGVVSDELDPSRGPRHEFGSAPEHRVEPLDQSGLHGAILPPAGRLQP